jgi:hypothetical protein
MYLVLYTGDPSRDCYTQPFTQTFYSHELGPVNIDPAASAAAAATAAVQALTEALRPASLQQHKVTLPGFWREDPVGWFQHAEAEFLLARIPANSYVCYIHVIRAPPSEILTAVRDLTRDITAATPDP